MKTLIAYAGKNGTTKKAAYLLKDHITNSVVVDLAKEKPMLQEYDAVIMGSCIHMWQMQQPAKEFLAREKETLLTKKTGYFICCGLPEKAEEEIEANIPEELRSAALVIESFGGVMEPGALKGMDKFIAKIAVKQRAKNPEALTTEFYPDKVIEFAKKFA
ncbi:MAG: flavodoxin domain-containing protein [Clostridiales bacterium]